MEFARIGFRVGTEIGEGEDFVPWFFLSTTANPALNCRECPFRSSGRLYSPVIPELMLVSRYRSTTT